MTHFQGGNITTQLRLVFAAVLVAAAGSAFAQQAGRSAQQVDQWQQDFAKDQQRTNAQDAREWEHSYDRLSRKRITELPKIRQHLAEAWQHFGMKPDAAKVVADAYVVEQPNLAAPPSIKGRTDAEVASMMQDALTKKQYLRADQLLIQYERHRLHLAQASRGD